MESHFHREIMMGDVDTFNITSSVSREDDTIKYRNFSYRFAHNPQDRIDIAEELTRRSEGCIECHPREHSYAPGVECKFVIPPKQTSPPKQAPPPKQTPPPSTQTLPPPPDSPIQVMITPAGIKIVAEPPTEVKVERCNC